MGTSVTACQTLAKPKIKAAIERKQAGIKGKSIATRKQRQQFWTTTTYDPSVNMSDRLRASELLGKSECDFITVDLNLNEQPRGLTQVETETCRKIAGALTMLELESGDTASNTVSTD